MSVASSYRLTPRISAFLDERHELLINGQWTEATSGQTFAVLDPATTDEIARVPAGDAEDIDKAVAAARAAFESGAWPALRPTDRSRLIWRLADLIEEHAEELAEL